MEDLDRLVPIKMEDLDKLSNLIKDARFECYPDLV